MNAGLTWDIDNLNFKIIGVERLCRFVVEGEYGLLRRDPWADVWRPVGIRFINVKNFESGLQQRQLLNAVNPRFMPYISFLGCKIGCNKKALCPIEQPCDQPMMLSERKPFNVIAGHMGKVRMRFELERLQ